MAQDEQSVISHLLEIESQASDIILSAQEESEKLLASTRAKADSVYSEKFRRMNAELEAGYNSKIAGYTAEHKAALEEYKKEILEIQKDTGSFDRLLDRVL